MRINCLPTNYIIMELLVAAEDGIYNYSDGAFSKIISDGQMRHFGLLKDGDILYYTAMDTGYKKGNIEPVGYIRAVDINTLDEVYHLDSEHPDIHHMVLWNNKIATLSVTGHFIVYEKDLKDIFMHVHLNNIVPDHLSHPPQITDRGPVGLANVYHFNYCFISNDKLYAMAHNVRHPSFILVYDLITNDVSSIELDGPMHHDCYVHDDKIYVSNSTNSEFLVLDMDGNKLNNTQLDGFTRGIAVTDNFIIVGSSENKFDSDGRGAKLFLLGKSSFSLLHTIEFVDSSAIYDILELT